MADERHGHTEPPEDQKAAAWDDGQDDLWPEDEQEPEANPPDPYPEFEVGKTVTDFATVDVHIDGRSAGALGLVLWGPSARRGGDWIALKLLLPKHAEDPAFRRAYEREALTWCHVWPHRCIVTASGLTRLPKHKGQPALILTYAAKGTLRDHLLRARAPGGTPISSARAFAWAQQIAAGLASIHAPDPDHERPQPLVHADVKPENILIDSDDVAQLTDLSVARAWAAVDLQATEASVAPAEHASTVPENIGPSSENPKDYSDQTVEGVRFHSQHVPIDPGIPRMGKQGPTFGTKNYMPPEQWLGEKAVVPRSDIFALGVVLFELFAGIQQRPHLISLSGEGTITQAIYDAHTSGPSWHLTDPRIKALSNGPLAELAQSGDPAAKARAQTVLVGLDTLVRQCLDPACENRPTAEEMVVELGRLAEQTGLAREEGLERMPITPETEATFWNGLAITYGHIGRHDDQERLARRAVELAPQDPELLANLASALSMSGHPEESLSIFQEAEARLQALTAADAQQAEQSRERTAIMLADWAMALDAQGHYQDAARMFTRSLDLDPTSASARYGLASTYVSLADEARKTGDSQAFLSNLREAKVQLVRILSYEPDYLAAQHALRRVQTELDKIENEIENEIKARAQATEEPKG